MIDHSETLVRFPFALREDLIVQDAREIAGVITSETDIQVLKKLAEDPFLDVQDYQMSCDGLYFRRIDLRCEEEWGQSSDAQLVRLAVAEYLCAARGYDPEEFDLALAAVEARVRVPYGMQPLVAAFRHVKRHPICLLHNELAGKRLLADIAGIAIHLQQHTHWPFILLPTENVRVLFSCRKIAVTGAIRLLLTHGILEDTGAKYGKRRARQFYCKAELGVHYVEGSFVPA